MSDHNAMVPAKQPVGIGNNLNEIIELGKIFAASGGFPGVSSPALAIVKILAGRELGFPAVASVCGIHMIEGKPSIGSHLLAAAIRGSGRYDFEIIEHTDQVCAVRFKRLLQNGTWKDLEPVERLTLKEAVEKGWTVTTGGKQKGPWLKTPKNMLFARCISNGYKFHAPDLFSGLLVYDQDELEPIPPTNGAVITQLLEQPVTGSHEQNEAITRRAGYQALTEIQAAREGEGMPADPTPAPQEAQGSLTEDEYTALVTLMRGKDRTKGDSRTWCQIMGVPTLDRAPRSRLTWLTRVATDGLVSTTQVDRITATLTALGTDFSKVPDRLQEKYGVRSLAHMLPSQADELERAVKDRLAAKLEAAKQLQPA